MSNKKDEDTVPVDHKSQGEDFYIQSAFSAYQLKTTYSVKHVDEIDLAEEDEDAQIFATQPYETVM